MNCSLTGMYSDKSQSHFSHLRCIRNTQLICRRELKRQESTDNMRTHRLY